MRITTAYLTISHSSHCLPGNFASRGNGIGPKYAGVVIKRHNARRLKIAKTERYLSKGCHYFNGKNRTFKAIFYNLLLI